MKRVAGDPVWQKINPDKIRNNHPIAISITRGSEENSLVGEADVLFAPAGFCHDNQSLESRHLLQIGRPWNPATAQYSPNQDGKIADADVARLKKFSQTDQLTGVNYAAGALVES